MMILGIDPGISGGAALVDHKTFTEVRAFNSGTPVDMMNWVHGYRIYIAKAYIEEVHSMPGQGVKSMFTFGQNYGWWQGILDAMRIPYERVTPMKWQTALRCRTGGDKNISKKRAQELFPSVIVTHGVADALLIAEYGIKQQKD